MSLPHARAVPGALPAPHGARRGAPLARAALGALCLLGCDAASVTDPGPTSAQPDMAAHPRRVLFFLGDGMGIATLTAARIYAVGEDGQLTIDTLPETAFVRTYSNDAMVTDSAPSMSAYMTGVKMNNEVLSMSPDTIADLNRCAPGNGAPVRTLLELAKAAGRGTGAVTTTRLTHATPAATYAHICHRDLENDIAAQAVPRAPGSNPDLLDGVDVLLGGGRRHFLPQSRPGSKRTDDRDLIAELTAQGYRYVDSAGSLQRQAGGSGKLLGLFTLDHMSFELDRDPAAEPSLADMTTAAVDRLSQNPRGFFLMVEGGRIDHALHNTNAQRALADTVAFDQAVRAGIDRARQLDPDLQDTLIVVTADHDHTLVLNGYARVTGPTTATSPGVLGLVHGYADGSLTLDADGRPYPILGFGNGEHRVQGPRSDAPALTDADAGARDYHQEAGVLVTAGNETHGGTDVFLGALGRGAEELHGFLDNTAVFGLIQKAAGL